MKCSLLCCIPPGPAGISACRNRRPYFSQLFSAVHISSAALLQGCYYFYLALQSPTVHRKDFNQSLCFHIFPPSSTPSHCFSPFGVSLSFCGKYAAEHKRCRSDKGEKATAEHCMGSSLPEKIIKIGGLELNCARQILTSSLRNCQICLSSKTGFFMEILAQTPKTLNIQQKQTRIYQSDILSRNMNEGSPFVNNEDYQNSD